MKKIDILIASGAMLLLMGCPYKAPHQLGNPSAAAFNSALLGTWAGCDAKDKTDCGRLVIYRFNETEYYAEMTGVKHAGSNRNININTDRYRAFMTGIGVPGLLDVQELSVSTGTNTEHFFVKAEIQPGNTLALSYMSDEFTKNKFSASEDLAGYIRKNYAKPGFFETPTAFEREKIK